MLGGFCSLGGSLTGRRGDVEEDRENSRPCLAVLTLEVSG